MTVLKLRSRQFVKDREGDVSWLRGVRWRLDCVCSLRPPSVYPSGHSSEVVRKCLFPSGLVHTTPVAVRETIDLFLKARECHLGWLRGAVRRLGSVCGSVSVLSWAQVVRVMPGNVVVVRFDDVRCMGS